MNLKQLEAFAGVVESKSFSRTAKDLRLTQPTISAHIASLERELGVKLLVRNTKEVHPSAQGEKLYAYARRMVELQRQICGEFGLSAEPQRRELSIAASTIPSQYILPEAMAEFCALNSVEQYSLSEADSAGVVALVLKHSVDIGLTGTVIKNAHCEYVPFYHDRLVVITPNSEKYRALPPNGFTAQMLMSERVIMREEGSGTRSEVEKYLRRQGVDVAGMQSFACINNQESIKKTVAGGMGVSVVSALAAQDFLEEGKLLAFDMSEGRALRDLNIVYNRDFPLTPTAAKFVEFLCARY